MPSDMCRVVSNVSFLWTKFLDSILSSGHVDIEEAHPPFPVVERATDTDCYQVSNNSDSQTLHIVRLYSMNIIDIISYHIVGYG